MLKFVGYLNQRGFLVEGNAIPVIKLDISQRIVGLDKRRSFGVINVISLVT